MLSHLKKLQTNVQSLSPFPNYDINFVFWPIGVRYLLTLLGEGGFQLFNKLPQGNNRPISSRFFPVSQIINIIPSYWMLADR